MDGLVEPAHFPEGLVEHEIDQETGAVEEEKWEGNAPKKQQHKCLVAEVCAESSSATVGDCDDELVADVQRYFLAQQVPHLAFEAISYADSAQGLVADDDV